MRIRCRVSEQHPLRTALQHGPMMFALKPQSSSWVLGKKPSSRAHVRLIQRPTLMYTLWVKRKCLHASGTAANVNEGCAWQGFNFPSGTPIYCR